MNATPDATTDVTEAPAPRVSAHADCDHPRTKAARAACRRARASAWVAVARGDVAKGDTVRVTSADDQAEGTLLGWGVKRVTLRDADGDRVNFEVTDELVVEAPKG